MKAKKTTINDMSLMDTGGKGIVLFHPYIPQNAIEEVVKTLKTRWIGQGPKVDKLERGFSRRFCQGRPAIAVGSGTDALHLAYLAAGIKNGDEVISPVFTCTATNIPLLYLGAKIHFADIQKNTLNIDPEHIKRLVTERTKAIVCVHYGGLPCDMKEIRAVADHYGIPVIEDAAQALGATYQGKPIGAISEYTAFSFQAIKHITTGDGGMLAIKDSTQEALIKRLRWFGIDRSAKQMGTWENDIREVGYKYQMTDIGASIALASLKSFNKIMGHRRKLFKAYAQGLRNVPGIKAIGVDYQDREHAAWIFTVAAEKRWDLQGKLREHNIESNQVHYRNDRYSIFGGRRKELVNMDAMEDRYLVLPIHHKVAIEDVQRICAVIRSGW